MLVENDITTGKKLMGGEIVELIGLLTNRNTLEKHTYEHGEQTYEKCEYLWHRQDIQRLVSVNR